MALTEQLPPSLETARRRAGEPVQSPVISLATDLTLAGRYGEEWLVVTKDRLQIYPSLDGGDNPVAPRLDMALGEIRSPRAESLVGGGSLVATLNGETVELLRYTTARDRKFSQAARYLATVAQYHEARAKGEPAPEEPRLTEDTEEEKRCPQCGLLLREGTKVCPACLNKGKVLWRIMGYLRPYWKQTVLVWALMGISTLLSVVPPYLIRPMIDVALVPRESRFTPTQRLGLLGLFVLGMLLAQALGQAISIYRGRIIVWLGTTVSHDLRTKLYQHLQLLSLRFFDKRQTGSLMARVTRDTESLEAVILDGAQFFVVNILVLLAVSVVLFFMNWKLALLVLIPMPVVGILSRWFWERMLHLWKRYWHQRQRLSASLNDSLSGVRVVRAFAQEQQEVGRFRGQSHLLYQSGMVAERTWVTFFPVLTFVVGLGGIIVWYFGGWQIIREEMTLGTLMAFIAYLQMFFGPMHFLSRLADYLARSLAAAERVFEILDTEPDVPEAAAPVALPWIEGGIEFRNVTFGYDAHKPVLQRIDLTARPGEMIGLVGHSGAGKSTLINLVCRFYDVQEGQILIDGHEIRRIGQHDLRSQIGVVLQDQFLFSDTIAHNIAYAKPGATREEVMAAAKTANAHDFILKKPDGYDTYVGERGQALSTGERQRIAIARAILHNPRILILDEATSAVDTDTEKQIQEAIARLVKGRTTFAIAHRLSTLRHADRLIVLKGGKIEEAGTHDELMAKQGEFYRLVQMQQEMSKIKAVAR